MAAVICRLLARLNVSEATIPRSELEGRSHPLMLSQDDKGVTVSIAPLPEAMEREMLRRANESGLPQHLRISATAEGPDGSAFGKFRD